MRFALPAVFVLGLVLLPSCCPATCSSQLFVTLLEGLTEFELVVTTQRDTFELACPLEPGEAAGDETGGFSGDGTSVEPCEGTGVVFEIWESGWSPPIVYELDGQEVTPLSVDRSTRDVCGVHCTVLEVQL